MASMQQRQEALSTSGLHVQDISAGSGDAVFVVVGPIRALLRRSMQSRGRVSQEIGCGPDSTAFDFGY
jgi:hypothetical protein